MKTLISLGLLLICGQAAADEKRYHFFVQFHDKGLNYVNIEEPHTYLSQRCLERRKRLNIPIDSLDLPVTASYIDNIRKPSIEIRYVSKWLNGAVISTSSMDSAFRLKIKFFVDTVVYLGKSNEKTVHSGSQSIEDEKENEKELYGKGFKQLDMLRGPALHQLGFRGTGMLIAVFDAGFKKANEVSVLSHLYENNRVTYTYDLVDRETNVYNDDDHGLHVLGCLAAYKEGKMIGGAPDASYVLIRTEANHYENWLEELNWVRAAEMADSMGVDIINSSLGYNTFDEKRLNHTHADLDGKSTYISRGAAVAAQKGILVVNSAGNDGNKDWGKIDFPADVEDILVVGAVDTKLEAPAFSSPGPTADYRIKPDIAALGRNTTVATTYGVGSGNGTSYSCPVIAGLMACLWQANPNLSVKQLRQIAIESSHMLLEPDNVMGHGLPDFNLALAMTMKHPTFDYSAPRLLNFNTNQFSTKETVTLYVPNTAEVVGEVRIPKRFLFLKYKKKKWSNHAKMNEMGFGQLALRFYNIPSGKEVEVRFFYIDTVTGNKVTLNNRIGVVQ